MAPRVLIADPVRVAASAASRQALAEEGFEPLVATSGDETELATLLSQADAVIVRRRPIAPALDRAKSLRFIQSLGRFVPPDLVTAARARGIVLSALPNFGNLMVAEHAFCLMIAAARQTVVSHRDVVEGAYKRRGLAPSLTTDTSFAYWWTGRMGYSALFQKTLGIVGLGDIGSALAIRARAFEMKVLYFRRHRLGPSDEATLGVEYRDLEGLLRESDFVSLHVPHTPETEKLMDGRRIGLMKQGAYLINTCRGGVVDEPALVAALTSGHLAGAGLDVFAYEPLPEGHPLTRLETVVLAPHLGSAPNRGLAPMLKVVAPNIRAAFAGGLVEGRVA
jgi:phosphoglycerate dehydrogenase-like enzyme